MTATDMQHSTTPAMMVVNAMLAGDILQLGA
jgi:hypothetical protein